MTYNVFGRTLNLAQFQDFSSIENSMSGACSYVCRCKWRCCELQCNAWSAERYVTWHFSASTLRHLLVQWCRGEHSAGVYLRTRSRSKQIHMALYVACESQMLRAMNVTVTVGTLCETVCFSDYLVMCWVIWHIYGYQKVSSIW